MLPNRNIRAHTRLAALLLGYIKGLHRSLHRNFRLMFGLFVAISLGLIFAGQRGTPNHDDSRMPGEYPIDPESTNIWTNTSAGENSSTGSSERPDRYDQQATSPSMLADVCSDVPMDMDETLTHKEEVKRQAIHAKKQQESPDGRLVVNALS